jgi:hypothetical protein
VKEKGQGGPEQKPKNKESASPKEQAKPKGESELSKLFEEKRLLAAWAPKGRDPESYPIEAMRQIQDEINERIRRQYDVAVEYPPDSIYGKKIKALDEILVDKLYALRESTDKVQKAYEIIAYPFCKNEELKKSIKKELELYDDLSGRGKVEPNDEELEVIGKMATIRRLPFDPDKRVYRFTEVPDFTTLLFRRQVFR